MVGFGISSHLAKCFFLDIVGVDGTRVEAFVVLDRCVLSFRF